ncbi:transcriptional attenuator, LytR family [Selenomonas ruminantium]|uniref:Transcriptional attenuator, LytR family n=1 Tax=Selenomonas ruminantium TaxID=971 RepID=A0A1M6V2S3_SELRU|nr:LCP family protein [Selenomonas ruminantium]SHK75753.1 transcriptional attenuator, LytR family [Selenomonas ruminantium]
MGRKGNDEGGKVNVTQQNIKYKRKLLAQRRRRARLRLLVILIFVGTILTGVLLAGYALVSLGSKLNQEYQDMYAGYSQRQQARRGTIDHRFDGYTNVLVMGIDDGVDEDDGEGKRADGIVVASLENSTGKLRFIHILQDTWVNVTGSQQQMKLKNLYALGGAPLVTRQVNALLGVSIHQYVVLDMQVFAELIDAIGGVDIYVESDMNYDDAEGGISIHLPQGYQHLDGSQAVQYLRYRSDDLNDLGRMQRQQRFCKALYQNLLQFKTLTKLPAIAEIIKQRVETSAEIFDSMYLANVLRHLSSVPPESIILPGAPAADDASIWVLDDAAAAQRMQELFPPENLSENN